MAPALLDEILSVQKNKSSVKILGVGTAVPPFRLTQAEALAFVLNHFEIRKETRALYKRTLSNRSIESRFFALDDLTEVLETDHDRIHARFEKWAVRLSSESLASALISAGLAPGQLDFIATTTCTGYLCPGLASHLIDVSKLRPDIAHTDLVGMGCAAALPALQQASNFVSAHPGSLAAVVCTEICSAAMFSNDSPDIVISNSIFSDGSAAIILKSQATVGEENGSAVAAPCVIDFGSLVVPEWRETLRFRTERGYLRNVLGKDVPRQAAVALQRVTNVLFDKHGLKNEQIDHWIVHAGGEKILREIQSVMGLSSDQLKGSWEILRTHGNMSSATVLFVLNKLQELETPSAGTKGVLCSFGAGFSAHAALVEF